MIAPEATFGLFALAILICTGVSSLSDVSSRTESLPTVKDIHCDRHEFLANYKECLTFTFDNGEVQYAGLDTFRNSKHAFKGDLYSINGDKIPNTAITLTKHDIGGEILVVTNGAILYKLNADLETGKVSNIDLGKYGGVFDDALPVPGERQAHPISSQSLPNSMTLRLQILYDYSFAVKYRYVEEDIKEAIQGILVHLQMFFHMASLTTRINLDVLEFKPIPYTLSATQSSLNTLGSYVKYHLPSIDADSYSVIAYDNGADNIGLAWFRTTCSEKEMRTNINEYFHSDILTAAIFAHEIGHNLGMYHDHKTVWSSKNELCQNIGGIMDGPWGKSSNISVWSPCSVEDFTSYYNRVVDEQGQFCLPSGDQPTTTTATTTTETATTTTKTAITTTKTATKKPRRKCNIAKVNDGICDDGNNHKGCFFDGNDCCRPTKPDWFKHCKKCKCKRKSFKKCVKPNYFGDGYCDDENNTPQCNYDGGDCCLGNKNYCTNCTCIYPKRYSP